ncbi:MAG: FAD-dependent oxidoreductase [Spirochaetota bacterium]|nr:MAG: FAD-dependent oxidoreductase [Spirochaetota bacterium]
MPGDTSKKPEKVTLVPVNPSPCTVKCPLGTNVKAYVSLVAAGRFAEALEVVRKTNPFPGICGRICPHPCEDECKRAEIDGPIAIAALKRFIADYELRSGIIPRAVVPEYKRAERGKEKVAIIGAGPAGLTCAADLAYRGFGITVFESLEAAGGMMAFGIPAYRLPRDILQIEIAAIEALGVDIRLDTPIKTKSAFDEIVKEFDAVFIATGAQKPLHLDIEGEDEVEHGVIDWVNYLQEVSTGRGKKPGDSVVIIGGGNTAVDCARVSLRLGAKDVRIVYRRSRKEMPAYENEVTEAQEEGVRFQFLSCPVKLLHKDGNLYGVECVRMRLGEKDASGRRKAIPIQGSRFTISCDAIIPAIGQQLDVSFGEMGKGLDFSDDGLLKIDPDTMATSMRGVFSGGDVITGAGSVVYAIASGHRAAQSIVRYIDELPLKVPEISSNQELELEVESVPAERAGRISFPILEISKRRSSFREVELGFTEGEAIKEAERCIRCGPCLECSECVGVCNNKQVIVDCTDQSQRIVRLPRDIYRNKVSELTYGSNFYEPHTLTINVNEQLCRGCGACEEICGYNAIQVLYQGDGIFTAKVNEDACRGCGTCVSVCPTGAIEQHCFSAERIHKYIDTMVKIRGIAVFACRWSSWVRSLTDISKHEALSVMCIGHVTAGDMLRAIERGARGVILIGCDDGCHYGFGKSAAQHSIRRALDTLSLLGYIEMGIRIIDITEETEAGLSGIIEQIYELEKMKGNSR